MRREVEYLDPVITRSGLKCNTRLTEAILNFTRRHWSCTSIFGASLVLQTLHTQIRQDCQSSHGLTAKDTPFNWTPENGTAFTTLKFKLVTPLVLAYPSFEKEFTLETDASTLGLGAVLCQRQDSKLHPIAYASHALNRSEKNYSLTELETLPVVWAITHFRSHLYVKVLTDHSAVKSVLETHVNMPCGEPKCLGVE